MNYKKYSFWKMVLKPVGILAALIITVILCVVIYRCIVLLVSHNDAHEAGNIVESVPNETITPSETPVPTPIPSPTPTHTPADTPTPSPTPVPIPPVEEDCLPENFAGFMHEVIVDGKIVEHYERAEKIDFPPPPLYSSIEGVATFRGSNWRDYASYGTIDIKEEKLEKVWFSKTGYIDIWTGVGWTGQPAIVKWDDDTREIMNIYPDKRNKSGLTEVIYATLDGKIYFLDIDDGMPTRDPIDAVSSHKGSVSVDPRGIPLLYAGQGIEEVEGKKVPCGMRIFSLIDGRELLFIDGYDLFTYRWWPAFDAAALFDPSTDTLIQCGENGIIYFVKLNTSYSPSEGTIAIEPEIVRYRYKSPYGTRIGVEASPVGYRNMIYFVDNSGLLQCVDVNTLEPVWLRNVNDDTDSTLVLEEEGENRAFLYTACEVDHQGPGGFSYIRKINAFSGRVEWEVPLECYHDTNTNGGALATPVIGKHSISNLVIFNIAKVGQENRGSLLIALDKETGNTVWELKLHHYSWSSPVAVYDKQGEAYLLICDAGGYMRLIEGKTGIELDSIWLEVNVEGSPAVFGDMVVVGTRGQKIWGVRIK